MSGTSLGAAADRRRPADTPGGVRGIRPLDRKLPEDGHEEALGLSRTRAGRDDARLPRVRAAKQHLDLVDVRIVDRLAFDRSSGRLAVESGIGRKVMRSNLTASLFQ